MTKKDDIIKASGWKPEDDLKTHIPGYWRMLPQGYRCLWSCRWATKDGLLEPGAWMDLEKMEPGEIYAEALDVLSRAGGDDKLKAGLATALAGEDFGGMVFYLRDLRLYYPEYCAPWSVPPLDGPGRLLALRIRPGWGEQKDYLGGVK